jgi:hypothetical protein
LQSNQFFVTPIELSRLGAWNFMNNFWETLDPFPVIARHKTSSSGTIQLWRPVAVRRIFRTVHSLPSSKEQEASNETCDRKRKYRYDDAYFSTLR